MQLTTLPPTQYLLLLRIYSGIKISQLTNFSKSLRGTIFLMKAVSRLGLLLMVFLPSLLFAQGGGFVPCGGTDCRACHFAILMDNVLTWLVGVLFIIFAIMLIVAGYRLVASAGNTQEKDKAKKMIMNGFIGFIIVLGAWLLVDFIMRALLVPGGPLGPWNTIVCTP